MQTLLILESLLVRCFFPPVAYSFRPIHVLNMLVPVALQFAIFFHASLEKMLQLGPFGFSKQQVVLDAAPLPAREPATQTLSHHISTILSNHKHDSDSLLLALENYNAEATVSGARHLDKLSRDALENSLCADILSLCTFNDESHLISRAAYNHASFSRIKVRSSDGGLPDFPYDLFLVLVQSEPSVVNQLRLVSKRLNIMVDQVLDKLIETQTPAEFSSFVERAYPMAAYWPQFDSLLVTRLFAGNSPKCKRMAILQHMNESPSKEFGAIFRRDQIARMARGQLSPGFKSMPRTELARRDYALLLNHHRDSGQMAPEIPCPAKYFNSSFLTHQTLSVFSHPIYCAIYIALFATIMPEKLKTATPYLLFANFMAGYQLGSFYATLPWLHFARDYNSGFAPVTTKDYIVWALKGYWTLRGPWYIRVISWVVWGRLVCTLNKFGMGWSFLMQTLVCRQLILPTSPNRPL